MAKKPKTFADKMKKGKGGDNVCPKCSGEIQRVKLIKSVKSETTNSWRFNQNMVDVCKCNEKEVYIS
jgi:hypothetical protein